jgi:hypothetical protein
MSFREALILRFSGRGVPFAQNAQAAGNRPRLGPRDGATSKRTKRRGGSGEWGIVLLPRPGAVASDPAIYCGRKISGRPCVPGTLLEEPGTSGRLRRTVATAAPQLPESVKFEVSNLKPEGATALRFIRQVLLHLCPVSSELSGHDVLAPETPRTSLRSDNCGTRKSQTAFRYLPEPPLFFFVLALPSCCYRAMGPRTSSCAAKPQDIVFLASRSEEG